MPRTLQTVETYKNSRWRRDIDHPFLTSKGAAFRGRPLSLRAIFLSVSLAVESVFLTRNCDP